MKLAASRWNHTPTESVSPELREKPRLLFLHGMGGTGALWRPIAAHLEEQYDILAPDQRGHGQSSAPSDAQFGPATLGQDVIDTMEADAFHPCWAIGHSMGVRTAVAAAFLKPEWFRGLILIDLGFSGPAGGGLGQRLGDFLRVLPAEFENRAAARAFLDANCPDPSMGQYLLAVATLHPRADGKVRFPFERESLLRILDATREHSVRPWLQKLAKQGMPILALRGATSRVWSHEDYESERQAFASLPSVQFQEVAGTGHGLPFEKRTEFIAIVRQFCSA